MLGEPDARRSAGRNPLENAIAATGGAGVVRATTDRAPSVLLAPRILLAPTRSYLHASTPARPKRTAGAMIVIFSIAAAVVVCACILIVRAKRVR